MIDGVEYPKELSAAVGTGARAAARQRVPSQFWFKRSCANSRNSELLVRLLMFLTDFNEWKLVTWAKRWQSHSSASFLFPMALGDGSEEANEFEIISHVCPVIFYLTKWKILPSDEQNCNILHDEPPFQTGIPYCVCSDSISDLFNWVLHSLCVHSCFNSNTVRFREEECKYLSNNGKFLSTIGIRWEICNLS